MTEEMRQEIADRILAMKDDSDIGEIDDGYHTFNELYEHRMMLFACLCNLFSKYAWRSKLHDDGTMFDGMFIVGISTPAGEATYHYDLKYWPIFAHCKTLEKAPKFDGHTPKDVLDRLFNMSLIYKAEIK